MASRVSMITQSREALALPAFPQMQLETEKERVSLLETLLQTQKELADATQQLERLRKDMKIQKLQEQVCKALLGLVLLPPPKRQSYRHGPQHPVLCIVNHQTSRLHECWQEAVLNYFIYLFCVYMYMHVHVA